MNDFERTGTKCDGIANFDGEAVTHFLRDSCIYAMDIAPDGTVWLQAGEWPRREIGTMIHLYVITPEAAAAAE